MAGIDFTINGLDNLVKQLTQAPDKIKAAVKSALYQFGEEVMADSKQIVPVDTGALMNTGHVDLPEEDGTEITVTLGYGDEAVGYALIVHEDLTPKNWSRPGSGPKYLEAPLNAKQDQLPDRVAAAVTKALTK